MIKSLKNMDHLLNLMVLSLFLIGVLFIYSAAYDQTNHVAKAFYKKQVIWFLISFVFYLFLFRFDYRKLLALSPFLYILSLTFLILVMFIGNTRLGAQRWLSIGGFAFQPSEFSKIVLILTLATYLFRFSKYSNRFKYFLGALCLMGVPMLLILKQPDLGTALIYVPILLSMLFVAQVPLKYLFGLIGCGAGLAPFMWFFLKEYQKNRLLVFINPDRDPLGTGYNLIQSKIAVGSGGLFGKGWLKGTQNQLNFLPERHTDFIFSVIGEEWGFLGSLLILVIYFVIIASAVNIADKAQDQAGKLMATGIATFMMAHLFINIGMTIGIMPIAGLPLPFLSYGGTSLITMIASIALLQNVYSRRFYF